VLLRRDHRPTRRLEINLIEGVDAAPGSVALYTGLTWWIGKEAADEQAQITIDSLETSGITSTLFSDPADDLDLADWMIEATDNGQLDVLVLYGDLPESIYASENAQLDDSLVELFLESTDGDVVLNHADWMFYGQGRNGPGGLQTIMDIPGIVFGGDNTPVTVTEAGAAIAPSLTDFLSDRPFNIGQLEGEWHVEVALARTANGAQADPVIVRDGNRGRLIPVYQTNQQADPKGAVAAEIITWLMGSDAPPEGTPFLRGDADSSSAINITDGIFILNFLFLGGPDPECRAAADADDSSAVNITDGIFVLNFLFLGGPNPPAPYPDCAAQDGLPEEQCPSFAGC
ncbi:MAG: hypothetical protein AAF517_22510, partial [Planctomycetota bacterium]